VKVAIITVSDRASRGIYEDRSGPEILRILAAALPGARFESRIVPDETDAILGALGEFSDCDWILTTGGTGPAPRDRTPEATLAWIDRQVPGLAEALRAKSLGETPNAVFSRGVAGMRASCFVVNLPGSVAGARSGAELLAPLMAHGSAMARGEGH